MTQHANRRLARQLSAKHRGREAVRRAKLSYIYMQMKNVFHGRPAPQQCDPQIKANALPSRRDCSATYLNPTLGPNLPESTGHY